MKAKPSITKIFSRERLAGISTLLIPLLSLSAQILAPSPAYANDPFIRIRNAFGSCSTAGQSSNLAQAQADTLANIYDEIQQDSRCASLGGTLQQLRSVDFDLLQQTDLSRLDHDALAAVIIDLENELRVEESKGAQADAVLVTALKSEIITQKLNLLNSGQESHKSLVSRRISAIETFKESSFALMNHLTANSACIREHPNLAIRIGAQILAISSNFRAGILGSSVLAAGQIVEKLVDTFKDKKFAKAAKALRQANSGEAIGCALEGLARTYCQARDAQTAISRAREIHESNAPACIYNPTWDGVNILNWDLPAYMDWLGAVVAGSQSGGIAQAEQANLADDENSNVRKMGRILTGRVDDSIDEYEKTPAGDQPEILKALVAQFAEQMQQWIMAVDSSGSKLVPGPLYRVFSTDRQCGPFAYLFSTNNDKLVLPKGQANPLSTCSEIVETLLTTDPANWRVPRLEEIKRLIKVDLVPKAQRLVQARTQKYLDTNSGATLESAFSEGKNRRKAIEFLDGTAGYLTYLLDHPETGVAAHRPGMRKLVETTLERVENARSILYQVRDTDADLAQVREILAPAANQLQIPSSLETIVSQDLSFKMSNGRIDEAFAIVLQLSSSDSLTELLGFMQTSDVSEMSQTAEAKKKAMSNLDSLAALFDDELRSRLDELAADFARNRSDRDAADRLALHCMRLLLVPKQGNYPGMKACQGLVYPPGSSGKPVSVSFDVASKLDDNARVCLLYDLFRKDQYHRLKVRETVPRPTPPQPQPRTPAREFE